MWWGPSIEYMKTQQYFLHCFVSSSLWIPTHFLTQLYNEWSPFIKLSKVVSSNLSEMLQLIYIINKLIFIFQNQHTVLSWNAGTLCAILTAAVDLNKRLIYFLSAGQVNTSRTIICIPFSPGYLLIFGNLVDLQAPPFLWTENMPGLCIYVKII